MIYNLEKLDLRKYFNVVLAGGKKNNEYSTNDETDTENRVVFVDTPFYFDLERDEKIPKSPRVILWYLKKMGINYIKTITLVDDLSDNDFGYDNFVHITKCAKPKNDWSIWQRKIENNIQDNDTFYKLNTISR